MAFYPPFHIRPPGFGRLFSRTGRWPPEARDEEQDVAFEYPRRVAAAQGEVIENDLANGGPGVISYLRSGAAGPSQVHDVSHDGLKLAGAAAGRAVAHLLAFGGGWPAVPPRSSEPWIPIQDG